MSRSCGSARFETVIIIDGVIRVSVEAHWMVMLICWWEMVYWKSSGIPTAVEVITIRLMGRVL